jgi:hypothetical protein
MADLVCVWEREKEMVVVHQLQKIPSTEWSQVVMGVSLLRCEVKWMSPLLQFIILSPFKILITCDWRSAFGLVKFRISQLWNCCGPLIYVFIFKEIWLASSRLFLAFSCRKWGKQWACIMTSPPQFETTVSRLRLNLYRMKIGRCLCKALNFDNTVNWTVSGKPRPLVCGVSIDL